MTFLILLTICIFSRSLDVDQEVVDLLNNAYRGFDPEDNNSPLGVFVHGYISNFQSDEEPYLTKCDYNCFQHYTSECRISIVLLNKVNGNMQDDWAYKKSMCSHLPQFCNVTIGIWPGVSQPYYSLPGIIYGSELGQHATKCAYAFDGSSDMRPNRGCACSIYQPNCAPNPNWPCPKGWNACTDQDPLNRFHKINANISVLTACQCATMGVTEDVDPRYKGETSETVSCLWQGSQFFEKSGKDQIRRALKQQQHFVKKASFPWNEIVVDGEAMNSFMGKMPSKAITAFYYPLTEGCQQTQCDKASYIARDNYKKRFNVDIPVIAIDITDGEYPFKMVN